VNIDDFGMDTITLAGPLEAKLRAIRGAGFTQVMLNAGTSSAIPTGRIPPCARCARAASG